ncbi:hypothetical protein CJU90_6258 [Yarrowia sp. C11]|nr:hypothetical protein CJU90_6258 [Yarrowia sp. C11]KAG5370963.1 hypothetical protein CKK34_1098 [Yarrowia sp. E02]
MKQSTLTLAALLTIVHAQSNPLVASIAENVVAGIVSAKTDNDVSDEQATSEIQSVVDIVSANTDVQNLIGSFGSMAMNGVDSSNFPELLSMATATLSAFKDSPDFSSASEGFKNVLTHYDVPAAKSNVANNLALIINAVTVALPSLTPEHSSEWEAATSQVMGLASSLGLDESAVASAAPSTSEASSAASPSSGGNGGVVVVNSSPPSNPGSNNNPGGVTTIVVGRPGQSSQISARSTVYVYATSGGSNGQPTTIEKPKPQQQSGGGSHLYNVRLTGLVAIAGVVIALI